MNDEIHLNIGGVKITVSVNALSAALAPYQLCVADIPAPAPPPQTEAERLVELANRLPQEVWNGSGWRDPLLKVSGLVGLFGNDDWQHFLDDQFHTILLGVMAAYVGTEPNADARCNSDGTARWFDGEQTGRTPDLLTAYAACCKAIAERRKVGTDA